MENGASKGHALPINGTIKYTPIPGHTSLQPPANSEPVYCEWVDKGAIMEEFNLSERTLYKLRKENKIPHGYIGAVIFYNRTEIEKMLKSSWLKNLKNRCD